MIKLDVYFEVLDEEKNYVLYVYVVVRIGFYFFKEVGIDIGELLVYLIVFLLEVMYGFDVVFKVVDVEFVKFFGFFFEINFGGGFLIGF